MSPIGLILIYYLDNSSNLSSVPVRIFCFVIHIISGISSRLRGHFYFIDNSTLGLVTRLRTGTPRSSLKRLQLFLYLHLMLVCPLIPYPLRLFHPKGVPWFSRALPKGKALLSTPLTLRCFQSRWCVSVPGMSRLSASTECHRADAPCPTFNHMLCKRST